MAIFFFCGIGGSGMSPIARYLHALGHEVRGIDRTWNPRMDVMKAEGILILPYRPDSITADIDTFVMTTAVEEDNPDLIRARELGLSIKTRPEMLAEILNARQTIAVGGTSGKTTTTAMIGHILHVVGKDPTMINGGVSLNTYNGMSPSNVIFGKSDLFVAETDESNGTIELYRPAVSVVTNISLDHKSLQELRALFDDFIRHTRLGVVLNVDCPEIGKLSVRHQKTIKISTKGSAADLSASDIRVADEGVDFMLNGRRAYLPMKGAYNVANALCAVGACLLVGVSAEESLAALQSFKGTERRLQTLGVAKGVTVIDDFAHNADEVRAAVSALKQYPGRLFVIFQPHGFGPMRVMKDDFVRVLKEELNDEITFIMPEILYKGGTVVRDVSSREVIDPLAAAWKKAFYIEKRADIIPFLLPKLKAGDRVVVMGARDDTLPEFGREILKSISVVEIP